MAQHGGQQRPHRQRIDPTGGQRVARQWLMLVDLIEPGQRGEHNARTAGEQKMTLPQKVNEEGPGQIEMLFDRQGPEMVQ